LFFVSDFKKLHVWQKAHALSLCVDRISKEIRGGRYASLRSQIFARRRRFPRTSPREEDILAHDTKAISEDDFPSLVTQTIRVRKMLYALLKCLSVSDRTPPAPVRAHQTARPEPTADPPTALGR
jgi:hypothetical protein